MATETSSTGTEGTETGTEEQQEQQNSTDETSGQEQQQTGTPEKPVQLPDDHPLVKTLAANKDKIAGLTSELTELRAKSKTITKLEEELTARPTVEVVEALQARYDRLEGFLQAVGGPLSKALDSRTFTRDLFETDKDIETLVKEYSKANPTATSAALGSGAAAPASKSPDMNAILRSAMK